MKSIINVDNLTKQYGNFTAVNDISFDVKQGEIFGLLGENGAGKTTTLEMIEGLRKPSKGKITVFDKDVKNSIASIKQDIGVQLQSSAYFEYLTLTEILMLFGSFYKKTLNPAELLEMVGLESKAKAYIKELSGGQKQRFSIVASLINDPQVVFLDEPTTGLDPVSRRKLWDIIAKIKQKGKTVVLTTHYLEEAQILCDRIAIMVLGKIIAYDETHKLIEKAEYPYKLEFFVRKTSNKIMSQLATLGNLKTIGGKTNSFELKLKNGKDLFKSINLIEQLEPESMNVGRSTLEDVFIELTGETLEESEENNAV